MYRNVIICQSILIITSLLKLFLSVIHIFIYVKALYVIYVNVSHHCRNASQLLEIVRLIASFDDELYSVS